MPRSPAVPCTTITPRIAIARHPSSVGRYPPGVGVAGADAVFTDLFPRLAGL